MSGKNIVDLESVFLPLLQWPTKKLVRQETKALTAPGENYGSLMLSLDITLKDTETNEEETIHTATKLVPQNELIQTLFQSHMTFKKEIEFYRTIIPLFQNFQKSRGIENVIQFVPKFYGGRIGLKSSDEYDTNAILILENLKTNGYCIVDRTVGFDLETAKFIIRDLATLHGTAIGFRKQKPSEFNDKIKPFLAPFMMPSGEVRKSKPDEPTAEDRDKLDEVDDREKPLIDLISKDPELSIYLNSFMEIVTNSRKNYMNPNKEPREPWGTLAHCDFWVNNTMVKFEEGKVVDNKMVDFQMYCYDSVARDLVFFIFTSVQNEVIIKHFDNLIDWYYDNLIQVLAALKLDTNNYKKDSFLTELSLCVKEIALCQSVFMLNAPIFATQENVKPVEELDDSLFKGNISFSQKCIDKLRVIMKECAKRNWL